MVFDLLQPKEWRISSEAIENGLNNVIKHWANGALARF